MATRLMRWPWQAASTRKFAVRLMVRGIEQFLVDKEPQGELRMRAEVRWKGTIRALSSLRSLKRNCTREEVVVGDKGELVWNEEFESVVVLTTHKESTYSPWEVEIAVFTCRRQGTKKKTSIYGIISLNLAEYACAAGEELQLNLPLLLSGSSSESRPILNLSLRLLEATSCPQQLETFQGPAISPPSVGDKVATPATKVGFRKIFKKFVSSSKSRKALRDSEGSDGRYSVRSDDLCYAHSLNTDSIEDDDPNDEHDSYNDAAFRKSFSYGTLADANFLGVAIFNAVKLNEDHENWVYYSHKRSDFSSFHVEEAAQSIPEKSPKRRILPWKKRKYSFKSKAKGEPLLKKAYGENGGDDIDYDRRLLSSPDESLSGKKAGDNGSGQHSSISAFGDDNFAVGCWEFKEITSRCGEMKLSSQVFFASIDQRSERAAGESACTALVAVIADWFQSNQDIMPIKSQLDGLIREGSLEWRNLCENQTYRERFPDKHFDLETVLQARIRPLSVIPGKSFVGFFHPEGCEDNSSFAFLDGAMSFDGIWEEINRAGSDCLFIVSWNDHFFILKVEQEACYIIDTLGERLYEGCDQAYILKFDKSTTIHRLPSEKGSSANEESSAVEEHECGAPTREELVCEGKESCKEYIKNFLAAIPIRELQADIKKGLTSSTPLYQRLQIELHYTEPSEDSSICPTFPPLQSTGSTTLIPSPACTSPEAGEALELYRI